MTAGKARRIELPPVPDGCRAVNVLFDDGTPLAMYILDGSQWRMVCPAKITGLSRDTLSIYGQEWAHLFTHGDALVDATDEAIQLGLIPSATTDPA